tara:strand:- start:384 stop:785 length:402 start_codon:yes stop_codon:yes gene_type:complete
MNVLAFGTFDGVHPGHENFFEQASKLGNLTVVIARDATVQAVKHRTPDHDEATRQALVQAQPTVQKAILGNTGNKYDVILAEKPDIIALGYDQTHFTEKLASWLAEHLPDTQVVRLEPFHPDKYKTSKRYINK